MAYLAKGKKQDLFTLASELGITVEENFRVIDLKNAIINGKGYDEEFTKELLDSLIRERKETEERLIQKENEERSFELEKLKLKHVSEALETSTVSTTSDMAVPKIEIKGLISKFDPKSDDIILFLSLFEKQLSSLKVPESKWVVYLISLLPIEIAKLIAKESDTQDGTQDYTEVKKILLRRFKMSAEKFRQLFVQHVKNPDSTWRDFFYDLKNFFDGWLHELKVTTLDQLKDLMITDQIKKKCPPDYKEHYLDHWSEWNDPVFLVDKLDCYEEIRNFKGRNTNHENPKKEMSKYKSSSDFKNYRSNGHHYKNSANRSFSKTDERPISCYGCGKPGYVKAKCPTCSPHVKVDSAQVSCLKFQSCSLQGPQAMLLKIKINGMFGLACADTGASHTVAGEILYNLLRDQGVVFDKINLSVTLADGLQKYTEVYKTEIDVELKGKHIATTLFALPTAKNNRTLLGTDFLSKAGIILDIPNRKWYFNCNPKQKFIFEEDNFTPPCEPEIDTCEKPCQLQNDSDAQFCEVKVFSELNDCVLRENEGKHLSDGERLRLGELLEKFDDVFQPGGEPTPYIEHRIHTGDHSPVAVPPYRMNPAKKEILKLEIERLLSENIIEACESPYASPVVLVPKQNGTFRVCIDYRQLNSITTPDNYPLPHMDDLLQAAKPTAFMSTIDLQSGYHQVKVHPDDQDKTAFVCPFGTYRFLRMPFGLRNAPATFQRLMDQFRNGLPSVNLLVYLDDLIVLSPTFEQHLLDLRAVFDRLVQFKLTPNREKCKFVCPKVKYLGLWITPKGVETDPEKVSAIVERPCPRNLKQLQSFIQTCSWYRKFIPNFSDLARPLTTLTKKNAKWFWGTEQQQAFEELKNRLVSAPILKQTDETKPFLIRTDASGYALGACLLQVHGSAEHPIEYASRLLTSAEKNYSTTEREALAVVWALQKFRGYIEGSEITVASDHQPLKWLMSLKSPSGRLARWALQIQAYNLRVQYTPGKANVIADMLSRPVNPEENIFCEISHIAIADMPARSAKDMREAQLQDDNLRKIIKSFEATTKTEDFANWTDRGFLLNQGVLYRYAPDADTEEAQLVIPSAERDRIMKTHHDDSMAGHYGEDGTFQRIAKRYYWTGMRKFIADYVKSCPECNRYKASNLKPAGLLRTPVQSQRFETISIDLFGPLPRTDLGMQWIFIVEDCATRWVELFALPEATAHACATTLIEEVFMRHGIPRRIICDNGPQFVSAVLQQICFTMKIQHNLIPLYCPQANPVERKNRDLKPRLAILVGNEHDNWHSKLPVIRFAMNTAVCDTTGYTPAFLTYGKELRTVDDVVHNFTSIVENDNFVAEITPYLKKFATLTQNIKERIELKQDQRKMYYDKHCRQMYYAPGDKVWVTLHPHSDARQKKTSKFMPKRDGPYLILTQKSPTSYEIASLDRPLEPLGTYHVSALKPFRDIDTTPVAPLRKRGRPPKAAQQQPTEHARTASTSRATISSCHSRQGYTTPGVGLARPGPASLPGRLRSQRGRL